MSKASDEPKIRMTTVDPLVYVDELAINWATYLLSNRSRKAKKYQDSINKKHYNFDSYH